MYIIGRVLCLFFTLPHFPLLNSSSCSIRKKPGCQPERGEPERLQEQSSALNFAKWYVFSNIPNLSAWMRIQYLEMHMFLTKTAWIRMDLAIPWRENTLSTTARNVSGNVFSSCVSCFSCSEISPRLSFLRTGLMSTSFRWAFTQSPPMVQML